MLNLKIINAFHQLELALQSAGNTRVVNQKELEFFREELQSRMSSNYNVILKEKKLPLSLLNDHQKVCLLGSTFLVNELCAFFKIKMIMNSVMVYGF